MASDLSSVVEQITRRSQVLETFIQNTYTDEFNNTVIQFEKEFSDMKMSKIKNPVEKYNIDHTEIATEIGCVAEETITQHSYIVKFIFQE